MKHIHFSEKGPRMNNEDCLNIADIPDKRTLFVVCDGMGGHSCGEVASQTVCDSFTAYWQKHPESIDSVQKIEDATKVASQAKGEAFLWLLNHLGIDPSETLAMGDGGSDIPLLRAAGIGIAMANALDYVKEAADDVTASCDEDGVALALEKYVFGE